MENSKIGKGLFWKLLERFGVQGVQFVLQIILARLLDPTHYGALSLITIFIGLATVFIQTGFNTALIQNKDVTDEDSARLSLSNHITKDAPPVFLAATAEDVLTGFGALPVAQKYSQLGLGYELHIFQHGPHGYALADETSADGSSSYLNPSFAHWHGLSVKWMHQIFGAPTFEKKNLSRMATHLAELGFNFPGL